MLAIPGEHIDLTHLNKKETAPKRRSFPPAIDSATINKIVDHVIQRLENPQLAV